MLVTQINLNAWCNFINNNIRIKYYISAEGDINIYTETFKIYELYLYNAYKVFYNDVNKKHDLYVYWGAFLYLKYSEFKDIPKILSHVLSKGDIDVIVDRINRLTSDVLFTEEELLHMDEMEKNTIMRNAYEDGYDSGYDSGVEEGIISMIKSFYKNNVSLELIASSTNKTIEEVKKILGLDD